MYCSNCGTQISHSTKFCSGCGKEVNQAPREAPIHAAFHGFSPRINDPAFKKYVKNSNRWSAVVSIILAVAAVIGFYIAGEVGAEGIANPQALFIGFGIGSMFIVIALFQIFSRKRSETWDGIVADKSVKKKTHHDEHSVDEYLQYLVVIHGDHGKKHVIKTRSSDIFSYYNIGDRVRHHAGLKSLEKYDKIGDRFIPCNACGTICNIDEDYCPRCKCPLLK